MSGLPYRLEGALTDVAAAAARALPVLAAAATGVATQLRLANQLRLLELTAPAAAVDVDVLRDALGMNWDLR